MRVWLASAAALAALGAVVLALWLGRAERETERAKRRVEDAVEEVQAAAELAASREGAGGARAEIPAPAAGRARKTEPAAAAEAELIVRVVGEEDGAPLPNVPLLHLHWPPEPLTRDFQENTVDTDELGLATFHVAAGGWRIYSPSQEDRKLSVDLAPGEKREEVLRLRSRTDLEIHLLIVDAQSGAALTGAEVKVESYPEERAVGPLGPAVADEDGRVAVRLPSWIAYRARVSARGYTALSMDLRGAHGDREHARRVALERTAGLHGTVTDEGGAPQAGVVVSANAGWDGGGPDEGADGPRLAEYFWSSEADADGRYAFPDLPAGVDLALAVRRAEKLVLEERTPLRLEPGEVRVRDLRLGQGSIRGLVLGVDGAPAPHLPLWLASGTEARELSRLESPLASTSTDGEGRFALENVPHGTWLIGPEPLEQPAPGAPQALAQVVELPPGVSEVEFLLRLPSALFVAGCCVDGEGRPVADVRISAVAVGAFAVAAGASAADGNFRLGPLAPGDVALFVEHDTLVPDSDDLPVVKAGDTDILLRLASSARVRGTVVDASTGARIGAEVFAYAGDILRGGGTSGSSGFEIGRLAPGRNVLVARTSPALVSAPYPLDLEPGEEAVVELQVAPGGWVRVLLPEGESWARLLVGGAQVGWLDRGAGTTALVPPGPLTVELRNLSGPLASKQVTVAAGETVEVDLR